MAGNGPSQEPKAHAYSGGNDEVFSIMIERERGYSRYLSRICIVHHHRVGELCNDNCVEVTAMGVQRLT